MCYVYIVIGKMNVNIVFTCPFIFCKSHCVQIVGFLKFNELIGGAAVFSITIDCPVAAQQEHLCCCVLCVCVCSLMLSGLYNRLHIWQSREFGRPEAADWCFILCLCSAGLGSVMRSRNPSLVLLKRVAEELAPQVGSLFSFLLTKGFKIRPTGPVARFYFINILN